MGGGSLVLAQVSVHGSYFPDIFFGLLLCGLGIGLAFVTAGYQSAFVACAVLAGIGLALALLLPGRPRKAAHELPEPVPAAGAAAAGDVVIRSAAK
jgi:hypothetical protein